MSDGPRLLVVDDEVVICQACRRVFSRQGFQVEESTDVREGLKRAQERDYAGILLDIKMPEMDGIEFLEQLRKRKPDIPVMIMTGYPSIPNAASAVRLGASDYVTKPFTPEEITQSVRRMLGHRGPNGRGHSDSASPAVESEPEGPGEEALLFLNESWVRPEVDGSACVGAVLARGAETDVRAVRLPQVGEVVYQGLPLAGMTIGEEPQRVVPAPVSGVVVGVNELLADDPSLLLNDPLGMGWLACVCTTRFEEEVNRCKPRRVLLANADEASARRQSEQLTCLGCRVNAVKDWEELGPAVEDTDYDVLLFDAVSFGGVGSELVRRVNATAPSLRVVVVASTDSQWEAAYRKQRIFYYAVEPFADKEIVEILDAVFRPQGQSGSSAQYRRTPSEPVSGIRITNRNGHKVQLLAAPGLLRRNEGLGWQIRRKLAERAFPIATTPGEMDVTAANVLKTAGTCDRVMVLLAGDTGRLPGSLVRDTKAEYVSASKENASRVTTLVVQPDCTGSGFTEFDHRTMQALAEHIVQEMASY